MFSGGLKLSDDDDDDFAIGNENDLFKDSSVMSVASKTGLIPTTKRKTFNPVKRKRTTLPFNLPTANVAKPAEFSIRPFGGLYNPYAKGCSVLCNHPAPTAVRSIIRKVKDSWSSEGKTFWQECITHHQQKDKYEGVHDDFTGGHIPEDLFRRYTDTDSRPLTPSPTTASVRTRTSAGSFLNARRCVTPEPGKDAMIKRKKIILDLRRSHSQETLYWRASSEVSQGVVPEVSRTTIHQDKASKAQKSEDHASKKIPCEEAVVEEQKAPAICINERDIEDNGVLQRRGKRRKKSKTQPLTTTFHISQDPETLIATLGPDSLSASTRPSLIPNNSEKLLHSSDIDNKPTQLKNSFLTEEAFRVLKTELDVDVIENTFERYLNRALREAIKFAPRKKSKSYERDNIELGQGPPLPFEPNIIPRKFSKSASRFEVPVDLASLERLSVFEYLSRHVWVSRQRKQLYKRTFLKFIKVEAEPTEDSVNPSEIQEVPPEDQENELLIQAPLKERSIPAVDLLRALKDILGFYGTTSVIEEVSELLKIDDEPEITFRPWCGIVAFAERFALANPTETDSCDELEKADFDTLEQRIDDLNLSPDLRRVMEKVREGHCVG